MQTAILSLKRVIHDSHTVTPGFEGKPNANHVRARIKIHEHGDYINDSS